MAIDVSALRVTWAIFSGARDIAIAFAHIAKAKLFTISEGPVLTHAADLRGCVAYRVLNVATDKASVLVTVGLAVEWVIPVVVAKARLEDAEVAAVSAAARMVWYTVIVGEAAFLK
jgi:hypothetical protein